MVIFGLVGYCVVRGGVFCELCGYWNVCCWFWHIVYL